jgi:hypothetical protein
MAKKKKKKKATNKSKAGPENLKKWQAENPEEAKTSLLKHGAFSKQIRRRYTDKRTREGRQLEGVIRGLIDDLGGAGDLSAAQCLLLDNIKSKLIVLFQIGYYVDRLDSIITDQGELIPCLGRNYTTYSESLRRDLEALFAMKRKPVQLTYEKALRALEGGKK